MRMPPEIAAVYFDFDWDRRKVWALEAPAVALPRARLDWHLDLPFWSTNPPEPLFDLRPRAVLERPEAYLVHAARIRGVDEGFSIDVMAWHGRACILDGLHRLARAWLEGRESVQVRWIPREAIPAITRHMTG